MAKVQRLNVILTIRDAEIDRYLDMGYNVIDSNGEVIQKSMPKDIPTLQRELADARAEIKALQETIKDLKTKQTSKPKTPKVDTPVEADVKDEPVVAKKTTTRKKKVD